MDLIISYADLELQIRRHCLLMCITDTVAIKYVHGRNVERSWMCWHGFCVKSTALPTSNSWNRVYFDGNPLLKPFGREMDTLFTFCELCTTTTTITTQIPKWKTAANMPASSAPWGFVNRWEPNGFATHTFRNIFAWSIFSAIQERSKAIQKSQTCTNFGHIHLTTKFSWASHWSLPKFEEREAHLLEPAP